MITFDDTFEDGMVHIATFCSADLSESDSKAFLIHFSFIIQDYFTQRSKFTFSLSYSKVGLYYTFTITLV